jgi:HAD superfamily hydrolase (TIGR01490 family)
MDECFSTKKFKNNQPIILIMPADFIVPMEFEEKTTKQNILEILIKEWPLTAKEIYIRLKRDYQSSFTYQAMHKTIELLIKKGVLVKHDHQYYINIDWINKIENIVNEIKSGYSRKAKAYGIKSYSREGDMENFVFTSYGDAEKYRKDLQKEYILKPNPKHPYCSMSHHYKSPLIYSEKSLDILKLIAESITPCYMLVKGNTPLDHWCANYYMNNPLVKIKTGMNFSDECETMVIGDVIVQTYVPSEIQSYTEDAYQKTKKISQLNIPLFFKEVYDKKVDTRMVTIKNAHLAEQIRRQIMSNFPANKASFFDIDGTIVKNFTMLDFASFLMSKKLFPKASHEEMSLVLNRYKSGEINYESFSKKFLEAYAIGMKGNKVKLITQEAKKYVESNKFQLYNYTEKLLSDLSKKTSIIAVTASTEEIVSVIGEKLGFKGILCSKLAKTSEVYNGKLEKALASRDEKKETVNEYLRNNPTDLWNSFAFGDTDQDIPFLEKTANPVVLNPNKEILDIARSKNWTILNESDDVLKKIQEKLFKI